MMSLETARQTVRAAVDAARFETSLPPGKSDDATVDRFLHGRRQEIIAVARRALDDYASFLHPEIILRLLYGEVTQEDFSVLSA